MSIYWCFISISLNLHTNENVQPECNCKSLWIKASAKCKM